MALLARGHTDAAAAAELAISERTVTNIMRSLMDRAGVQNRFQLGVVLGSLGALKGPEPDGPAPGSPAGRTDPEAAS